MWVRDDKKKGGGGGRGGRPLYLCLKNGSLGLDLGL
jgi:hypothetical protein